MAPSFHRTLTPRPWALWLAVLVALLAALAPALTHAFMPQGVATAPGVEICTDQGTRWVTLAATADPTDPAPATPTLDSVAHCAFCLQPPERSAPPPQLMLRPTPGSGATQPATVTQARVYGPPLAFAPPPRGPPAFF